MFEYVSVYTHCILFFYGSVGGTFLATLTELYPRIGEKKEEKESDARKQCFSGFPMICSVSINSFMPLSYL